LAIINDEWKLGDFGILFGFRKRTSSLLLKNLATMGVGVTHRIVSTVAPIRCWRKVQGNYTTAWSLPSKWFIFINLAFELMSLPI